MQRTVTHRGREYVVSAAHPAAEAFPWMSADELDALAGDLRENPQRFKIRVQSGTGLVFDGRNRELACRIAGVDPQYAHEDMTDAEVVAFVSSANLMRRDLTPGQKAAAAADLARLSGRPVSEVAAEMGAKERTARYAAEVQKADPALFEQVKAGELPVRVAADLLDLPAEVRAEVAAAPVPAEAAKAALEGAEEQEREQEPEAAPVPPEESRPSFNEWQATLPTREQLERKKGLKPGSNVDPDHPYARSLAAMTALVKALNADLADDETGVLKASLSDFARMKASMRMVLHRSGGFRDGKVTEPCAKFVGLALLRAVVRDCGKKGKRLTRKQFENLIERINGAPESELMDKEDCE